jgi:hypothetical protein
MLKENEPGAIVVHESPVEQNMLDHTLDAEQSILFIRPKSSLSESDFVRLAETVDPHIVGGGALRGIIIEAPEFPGWESFGAMAAHFRFVRDHHQHVGKVALVTDSALATLAENLASHFVTAEIKSFRSGDFQAARRWVLSRS